MASLSSSCIFPSGPHQNFDDVVPFDVSRPLNAHILYVFYQKVKRYLLERLGSGQLYRSMMGYSLSRIARWTSRSARRTRETSAAAEVQQDQRQVPVLLLTFS